MYVLTQSISVNPL